MTAKKRTSKKEERASEVVAHSTNLFVTGPEGDPVEEWAEFELPQNPQIVFEVNRLGCQGFRARQEAFQRELFRYGKIVREDDGGGITIDFAGVDMAKLDPYRFMRDEEGIARELVRSVRGLEVDDNPVSYEEDPGFAVRAVVAVFGQYPFIREWLVECATEVEERFQQAVGIAAGNSSDSSPTAQGEEETSSPSA